MTKSPLLMVPCLQNHLQLVEKKPSIFLEKKRSKLYMRFFYMELEHIGLSICKHRTYCFFFLSYVYLTGSILYFQAQDE